MDIELADGTAFQILDTIVNYDFEVVFITGHQSYIQTAIEYYAFHFLTKPVDISQLSNIIERYTNIRDRFFSKLKYDFLKEYLQQSQLLVNTGNEHISVDLNNLITCQADGNYTIFQTQDEQKYFVSRSLKYYENLLKHKGFFRPNRQVLINIKHIRSVYKKESITLSNNKKIIVSVRNRTELAELLKDLS